MNKAKRIKRRCAWMLNSRSIVIDVTEEELELIKRKKIEIEQVKVTPKYIVYRKKPR